MDKNSAIKFTTIDQYHKTFTGTVRERLDEIRALIKSVVPAAEEVISYNMPAFKANKVLVYYAGYEAHIGFYPTSEPIVVFKDKLAAYKTSKGAIQFPLDKPIPKTLVRAIVKFRRDADTAAAKHKKTRPILKK